MPFDQAAAAFGLFFLTFANLEQQLAAAVFYIRRTKDPNVKFEDVRRRNFSELRKELKEELKQFERAGNAGIDSEVQGIRQVCSRIGDLNAWRRARAHPRVQIDEGGIAIYDAQTLKHMPIDHDECVRKIKETIGLTSALDMHVGSLLRHLKADATLQKMLDEILSATEAADDE